MDLFVLLLLFLASGATRMPARHWPKAFTQMAMLLQLIVQQTHLSGLAARINLTMSRDRSQATHYLSPSNLYCCIPRCQYRSIPIEVDLLSTGILWASTEHKKSQIKHPHPLIVCCMLEDKWVFGSEIVGGATSACVCSSVQSVFWQLAGGGKNEPGRNLLHAREKERKKRAVNNRNSIKLPWFPVSCALWTAWSDRVWLAERLAGCCSAPTTAQRTLSWPRFTTLICTSSEWGLLLYSAGWIKCADHCAELPKKVQGAGLWLA